MANSDRTYSREEVAQLIAKLRTREIRDEALDGLRCIRCGAIEGEMVPVAHFGGNQVFEHEEPC